MTEIVAPTLHLVAGVAVYAAVQNFVLGLGSPRSAMHLIHSAICLFLVPYLISQAQVLHAATVAEYVTAMKWNLSMAVAAYGMVAWFVHTFTGTGSRPWLAALSVVYLLLAMVNPLLAYGIQFSQVESLYALQLPWGETVARMRGTTSPWIELLAFAAIGTTGYVIYALTVHYRRTRSFAALAILVALGMAGLATLEGMLVRLSILNFVELGPIAGALLLISMGMVVAHETKRRLLASESKFHSLFESSPQAMVAIDARTGAISETNESAQRLLGFTKAELLARTINDLTRPEDLAESAQRLEQFRAGRTDRLRRDRWLLRKDGSAILTDCSVAAQRDGGGELTQLIVSASDITERRRSEIALEESERRLRALFEQSPVAISCSRGGVTVDVNPAFLKLFGYGSVDEVRGNSVLNRIAPQCRAEVQERVRKRAQGLVDESSYESAGLRKDGTQFPLLVSAKNVLLSDGPATFAFLIDFSERKAAEARIQHLAFYDQLTDLANRQLLDDRVRRALAASARSGRHGAMLLIDLDNFKTVNDTLGHVAGDKLLREIAARLSSVVRERDSVARLGGDEFVVLLEALSERQPEAAGQAEAIGEKIRNLLGEPYTIDAKAIRCSCSIGVTLFGHQHMTPEDVVRQADIAMYEAKSEGRNALRFFDPQMQEMINARVLLENELHRALEAEQFAVHFQVQVDHTMLPIGAEALLRWQHPDLGLVSPAYFIPLAEETGLIVPIGQWVLQTACAQLAAWSRDAAMRELVLAINVSSKQFRKPDFPDQVRAALQVHGVDPARLKLELTESMLLDDIEETISKMNALKTLGVKFSLDDFGTGYSSLQYLKRLPLDQLKIDQSFVRDIAVSANDHAIVRTVVAMAHSLNVDVIAEGVETEEQRKLLLACGCLSFQGYLFAKPVPAPRLEDFVQASLAGRRNALAKVPDGTQR